MTSNPTVRPRSAMREDSSRDFQRDGVVADVGLTDTGDKPRNEALLQPRSHHRLSRSVRGAGCSRHQEAQREIYESVRHSKAKLAELSLRFPQSIDGAHSIQQSAAAYGISMGQSRQSKSTPALRLCTAMWLLVWVVASGFCALEPVFDRAGSGAHHHSEQTASHQHAAAP